MNQSPETRASLLLRIRDAQDHLAWTDFIDIYAPLIHAYSRNRGLQDADAADVTQEVLRAVAVHAERFDYDPARGSFRGWLFRVTLNKLRDHIAKRKSQMVGSGDSGVQELLANAAASECDQDAWDQHHAWRLFVWAAEKARVDFREKTWQAFWRTAVEQQSVEDTSRQLELSAGAVHVARCRVMARIKELLEHIEPS